MNKFDEANLVCLKKIESAILEVYPFPPNEITEHLEMRLLLEVILARTISAIRKVQKETQQL